MQLETRYNIGDTVEYEGDEYIVKYIATSTRVFMEGSPKVVTEVRYHISPTNGQRRHVVRIIDEPALLEKQLPLTNVNQIAAMAREQLEIESHAY